MLITLSIMAILLAIIIPNVSTLLGSGNLAAANEELRNVRTAATGYRAQTDVWPGDSDNLTSFLSGSLRGSYLFDTTNGRATNGAGWAGLVFNAASQAWEKAP